MDNPEARKGGLMKIKFLRQQGNFKKRIKKVWRKPKGKHSKLREKRHGMHPMPNIGYRSPRVQRDMQDAIIIISNIRDLEQVKTKGATVTIAASIGNKKKTELLQACIKKGLIIKNFKKPENTIKAISENFTKRKEEKAKKLKIKTQKREEAKKKETEKKEEAKKKAVVVKQSKTEEKEKTAKTEVKKE